MVMTASPSSVTPRRTQAERRDESERNLLDATLRVVATGGVNAATFEAIGREAGYSRGLATQRFGSKRGLIDAVIAHLHQQREAVLEADHVTDMPALDAVVYYVDSHLRGLSPDYGGRAYFMMLAGAVADASSVREAFAQSHERVRRWLEALIRRGQAEGDVRRDLDPTAAALTVGSLMLGVSIQWLVDPKMDINPIRLTSIDMVRRSLSAKVKA